MDKKYAYQIPEGVDPHAWIVAEDFKDELQVLFYLARGSCYLHDYIHYVQARWDYSESKIRTDVNKLKKWGLIRFVDAKKVKGSKYSYIALTNKGTLYARGISINKSILPSKKTIANRNQLSKSKALLYVDRCDRERAIGGRVPMTYKTNNRVTYIAETFCKNISKDHLKTIRAYFRKTDAKLFYLRDVEVDAKGFLLIYCFAITETDNELDVYIKINKWISEFFLIADKTDVRVPFALDLVIVTNCAYDAIATDADRLMGRTHNQTSDPFVIKDKMAKKIMDRKKRKEKVSQDSNAYSAIDVLSKIDIDDPRTRIKVVSLKNI